MSKPHSHPRAAACGQGTGIHIILIINDHIITDFPAKSKFKKGRTDRPPAPRGKSGYKQKFAGNHDL